MYLGNYQEIMCIIRTILVFLEELNVVYFLIVAENS